MNQYIDLSIKKIEIKKSKERLKTDCEFTE